MIIKIFIFIASIVGSLTAGFIGSLATTPNIPTWYAALEKPMFNPPNWVFGPVWSLLYLLMGIALGLVILQIIKQSKKWAYIWFGMQLVLNGLWSLVFFGLHGLWAGVIIILLLLVSIAFTIREFHTIKPAAAWLLIPYIAWVGFATYLIVAIALLNS